MGRQRYISKLWQRVESISCNWGDPSCMGTGPPLLPRTNFPCRSCNIWIAWNLFFLKYRDYLWNIWTPIGPSTVERYGPQQRWWRTQYDLKIRNLLINHKNKRTAHKWSVLASLFLWATNNWLELCTYAQDYQTRLLVRMASRSFECIFFM